MKTIKKKNYTSFKLHHFRKLKQQGKIICTSVDAKVCACVCEWEQWKEQKRYENVLATCSTRFWLIAFTKNWFPRRAGFNFILLFNLVCSILLQHWVQFSPSNWSVCGKHFHSYVLASSVQCCRHYHGFYIFNDFFLTLWSPNFMTNCVSIIFSANNDFLFIKLWLLG